MDARITVINDYAHNSNKKFSEASDISYINDQTAACVRETTPVPLLDGQKQPLSESGKIPSEKIKTNDLKLDPIIASIWTEGPNLPREEIEYLTGCGLPIYLHWKIDSISTIAELKDMVNNFAELQRTLKSLTISIRNLGNGDEIAAAFFCSLQILANLAYLTIQITTIESGSSFIEITPLLASLKSNQSLKTMRLNFPVSLENVKSLSTVDLVDLKNIQVFELNGEIRYVTNLSYLLSNLQTLETVLISSNIVYLTEDSWNLIKDIFHLKIASLKLTLRLFFYDTDGDDIKNLFYQLINESPISNLEGSVDVNGEIVTLEKSPMV